MRRRTPCNVTPSEFVLAHLSDLHLSSLEGVRPRALLGKRILGYLSWRIRRRREHRMDVLDALRADLAFGTPRPHRRDRRSHAYRAAAGIPRGRGMAGESWAAGAASPSFPAITTPTSASRGDDTFAQWSAYMRGDDAGTAAEGADAFPTLRVRRHVAMIGLSTALPSAPFLATGRLGERQLRGSTKCWRKPAAPASFASCCCITRPRGTRCARANRCATARRCATCSPGAGRSSRCTATRIFPRRRISTARTAGTWRLASRRRRRSASTSIDTRPIISTASGAAQRGWSLRVAVRTYSLDRGRFVSDDGRRLRQALAAAPA